MICISNIIPWATESSANSKDWKKTTSFPTPKSFFFLTLNTLKSHVASKDSEQIICRKPLNAFY
jgi:hypothetical protein